MPWMTIREAAETLKVSRRTIRRMIKAGTLTSRLENGMRLVLLRRGKEIAPVEQETGRNQGLLSILFETYESFRALKARCLSRLALEKTAGGLFTELSDQERRPAFEGWVPLYQKIQALYKSLDGMVSKMTLTRDVLQGVYRGTLDVRETWGRYDLRDSEYDIAANQEVSDENTQAIMDSILNGLKKLLIGCVNPSDAPDTGCDIEYDTERDMSYDTPSERLYDTDNNDE
ncbi:MAG: helix-turn-helix domain-containing protein [Nitrospirae bacterium]|nr:helix-turn-helix domain-containing protein [Nitrospirota bacterium]